MSENFYSILLGIGGSLLGVIIGLVGNFLLQKHQKVLLAEDRRREWKKQYREKQVELFLTLVRTWLDNPESFYKTTEKGLVTYLPRASAWGIPDESLRKKALHFLELIGEYNSPDKSKSSEETRIRAEIIALCPQLETEFERYISEA